MKERRKISELKEPQVEELELISNKERVGLFVQKYKATANNNKIITVVNYCTKSYAPDSVGSIISPPKKAEKGGGVQR